MNGNRTRLSFLYGAVVAASIATTALPARAGDTGIIAGVVVDGDKKPVAGASVTLSGPTGRYHTVTDRRGRFSIVGVYVDTYTIEIGKPGCVDVSMAGAYATGDEIQDIGKVVLPSSNLPVVAQAAH